MVIVAGISVRYIFSVMAIFNLGTDLCLKMILRLGIIPMGIPLSIFEVLKIGAN